MNSHNLLQPNDTFPVLSESNLPEVLALCEQKIIRALSVVANHQEEQSTEEPVTATSLPPAYTVRIRLPYNDKQAFLDHIGGDEEGIHIHISTLRGQGASYCLAIHRYGAKQVI